MERNDGIRRRGSTKTDGEVNVEEELICALSKINKLTKKNLKQKE